MAAWAVVAAVYMFAYTPVKSDWTIYFDTARALRASAQADLWRASTTLWGAQQPGACPTWGIPYVYPPLLVILLVPLTFLPCGVTTMMWTACGLMLALVSAALLAALGKRTPVSLGDGWTLAAFAVVLTYAPLLNGIALGQVHLLVLCSCLGGVMLAERGHDGWGGIALSLGFWLKYVPGAIVLYYLLAGRWRVAMGAALGGLVLLLVQLVAVGPRSMLESLGAALGESALAPWGGLLPGGPGWHALQLAVIGAFVGSVLLASRGARAAAGNEALGASWAITTLLVVSPVGHWFYVTWLLPAFWMCLQELITRLRRPDAWGGKALGWLLLVALGIAFAVSWLSFYPASVLSIVAMWLLSGALYLERARVRPATEAQGVAASSGAASTRDMGPVLSRTR